MFIPAQARSYCYAGIGAVNRIRQFLRAGEAFFPLRHCVRIHKNSTKIRGSLSIDYDYDDDLRVVTEPKLRRKLCPQHRRNYVDRRTSSFKKRCGGAPRPPPNNRLQLDRVLRTRLPRRLRTRSNRHRASLPKRRGQHRRTTTTFEGGS